MKTQVRLLTVISVIGVMLFLFGLLVYLMIQNQRELTRLENEKYQQVEDIKIVDIEGNIVIIKSNNSGIKIFKKSYE
jgi:uncharacterized membrane protein SpoIIM required for sporulation